MLDLSLRLSTLSAPIALEIKTMADNGDTGESLQDRLHARKDSQIIRRSAPDGGSVYSGEVVRRSLKALGARAMTMDSTIFVSSDFDLSKSEDKALYAHERHHLSESGGKAGHHTHDAEEHMARRIENMVFHRSEAGEDFSAILRDVADGNVSDTGSVTIDDEQKTDLTAKLNAAIAAELKAGKNPNQLIRELSTYVVEQIVSARQHRALRG
jgi:hypothetical protein